jgi:hypothetical protein
MQRRFRSFVNEICTARLGQIPGREFREPFWGVALYPLAHLKTERVNLGP